MLHQKGIKIICILALTIILQVNSQCNADCLTCTGIGACSACFSGFALTGADTCTNCALTNQFSLGIAACAVCTTNCATTVGSCNAQTGLCNICQPGYSNNAGVCTSCALTNQFSLGLSACAPCTANCATGACNAATGVCSSCSAGFTINLITNTCTSCALTN